MPSASALVQCHERGMITTTELITRLIWLAVETPPEAIAPSLPTDFLDDLRSLAHRPPEAVEDCPRTIGIEHPYRDEERVAWFAGIWRWHRHFAGGD